MNPPKMGKARLSWTSRSLAVDSQAISGCCDFEFQMGALASEATASKSPELQSFGIYKYRFWCHQAKGSDTSSYPYIQSILEGDTISEIWFKSDATFRRPPTHFNCHLSGADVRLAQGFSKVSKYIQKYMSTTSQTA